MNKSKKYLRRIVLLYFALNITFNPLTINFIHADTEISVQDALMMRAGDEISVKGYIVGVMRRWIPTGEVTLYTEEPYTTDNNIVLADHPNETDFSNLLPVFFINTSNENKKALNLVDNPDNIGRVIKIEGILREAYSNPMIRLQDISGYSWVPLTIQHTPPLEAIPYGEAVTLQLTTSGGHGTVTAAVYYKNQDEVSFKSVFFSEGEATLAADEMIKDIEYYIIAEDKEEKVRVPSEEGTYRIIIQPEESDQPDPEEDANEKESGEEEKESEDSKEEDPVIDDEENIKNGDASDDEKQDLDKGNNQQKKDEGEAIEKEDKGSRNRDGNASQQETQMIDVRMEEMLEEGLKEAPNENDMLKFSDIEGHWAQEYISILAELGVVRGYGDGSFRPDQPITNGELITIIVKMLGYEVKAETALEGIGKHWSIQYIATAVVEGIIEEDKDVFANIDGYPKGKEIISTLEKALGMDFIHKELLYEQNIVTRGEIAEIMIRILEIVEKKGN